MLHLKSHRNLVMIIKPQQNKTQNKRVCSCDAYDFHLVTQYILCTRMISPLSGTPPRLKQNRISRRISIYSLVCIMISDILPIPY